MTVSNAEDLAAFQVSNNADWNETFDVLDGDVPFDLTGCSLKMQLRETPDGSTVFLNLDSNQTYSGIRVLSDKKTISIKVTASAMAVVPAGSYVRDILILRGGEVIYAGRGPVTVLQGITR